MTTVGYGWCGACGQPVEYIDHKDREGRQWGPGWIHGWTNSPYPNRGVTGDHKIEVKVSLDDQNTPDRRTSHEDSA